VPVSRSNTTVKVMENRTRHGIDFILYKIISE
jgi:hypothetical protein